jgi:hypothetical protein
VETIAADGRRRFSFGVPWPWYVEPEPYLMSGSLSAVQVTAPRADGQLATVSINTLPEQSDIDDSSVGRMAKDFAKQRGGRSRGARRLRIGGLPAIELTAVQEPTHFRLIMLPVNEVTVHIDVELPEVAAAGYGAHLDTMLATWSWH